MTNQGLSYLLIYGYCLIAIEYLVSTTYVKYTFNPVIPSFVTQTVFMALKDFYFLLNLFCSAIVSKV